LVIFVEEKSPALKDPVIKVCGGEMNVKGMIHPGEYMKFSGVDTVTVYDRNWNVLRTLPVSEDDPTVQRFGS
jgi:hypothetical protein